MKSKTTITARITERHGYIVTIALVAEPPAGAPTDLPGIPFEMHEAAHRVAAEIWASAKNQTPLPRWAVDVSYARVVLTLTEGESLHLAICTAEAACMWAKIEVAGSVKPPVKAAPRKAATPKRRAAR